MSLACVVVAVTALAAVRVAAQPAVAVPEDTGGGVVVRDIPEAVRSRAAEALTVAFFDEGDIRAMAVRAVDRITAYGDGTLRIQIPCRGSCVGAGTLPWFLARGQADAVASLRSDDPQQRQAAVDEIDRTSEAGVTALAGALADPNRGVRTLAAVRLDSVRTDRLVPGWIALLADTDPSLRERAAISLGVIGSPAAIDALGGALRDPELAVRRQAIRSLVAIATGQEEWWSAGAVGP